MAEVMIAHGAEGWEERPARRRMQRKPTFFRTSQMRLNRSDVLQAVRLPELRSLKDLTIARAAFWHAPEV